MPNKRESKTSLLTVKDYDIAGNSFRAWFDSAGNLVFVVDNTLDPQKPNALLVINPVQRRKWDNILSHDWGVDLETVRPKKDNKYQKLDIVYQGLDIYAQMIRLFESDADLSRALGLLSDFRKQSMHRIAMDRMSCAEAELVKARDTVTRTQKSIKQLSARLDALRTKLSTQRAFIGREPTKQSASKILRTESQIEATNAKLKRAKTRLGNALHRMENADKDAKTAAGLLAEYSNSDNLSGARSVPTAVAPTAMTVSRTAPVPTIPDEKSTELVIEPKGTDMAEEVKPLFDKDPQFLDDNIAFKPINFDVPLTPPESIAPPEDVQPTDPVPEFENAEREITRDPIQVRPITDTPNTDTSDTDMTDTDALPNIAPAPASTEVRPVAPLSTKDDRDAVPVAPVAQEMEAAEVDAPASRPVLLYYGLLVFLILLSIFTLWLYQNKAGDRIPDLAGVASSKAPVVETVKPVEPVEKVAPVETNVVTTSPETEVDANPFIDSAPVAQESVSVDTVKVASTETVQESVPIIPAEPEPEPEPVQVEPLPEPEPVVEPEPTPVVEPEPVSVNKPAYNVSSQKITVELSMEKCEDGGVPDAHGCCGGEEFTELDDGSAACCLIDGDECFPPLF